MCICRTKRPKPWRQLHHVYRAISVTKSKPKIISKLKKISIQPVSFWRSILSTIQLYKRLYMIVYIYSGLICKSCGLLPAHTSLSGNILDLWPEWHVVPQLNLVVHVEAVPPRHSSSRQVLPTLRARPRVDTPPETRGGGATAWGCGTVAVLAGRLRVRRRTGIIWAWVDCCHGTVVAVSGAQVGAWGSALCLGMGHSCYM